MAVCNLLQDPLVEDWRLSAFRDPRAEDLSLGCPLVLASAEAAPVGVVLVPLVLACVVVGLDLTSLVGRGGGGRGGNTCCL